MWYYNYGPPLLDEDELAHHGIKGMKWGVIRSPAQLGHRPKSSKRAKKSGMSKSKRTKPAKVKKTKPAKVKAKKPVKEKKKDLNKASYEEQMNALKNTSSEMYAHIRRMERNLGGKAEITFDEYNRPIYVRIRG